MCIQEEGGNDCGGSRREGMKEDERSCQVRGKMKEEEVEEKSRGWSHIGAA